MKKRIMKTSLWFIAGFAAMFCFRLAFSYSEKTSFDEEDGIFGYIDDAMISRKNYASDSYKYRKESVSNMEMGQATIDVSQKYEKTATMRSKSEDFEKDEKQLKAKIRQYNAIIQYEENTGNKGNRRLNLLVGVKPEKFDTFFLILKQIGHIRQADITKVDKTSEYKKLNAQKVSLEKVRESLIQLKNQSGKIDEYINLENRILELEEQLQDLGVEIGDFDEENEFCTIKFSMAEGHAAVKMSFLHRAKVSLEWAITWYFWMTLILLFIIGISFFLLLAIDKLRILQAVVRKVNENKQ